MKFNYCPNCGKHTTIIKHSDTYYACAACPFVFYNNAKATVAIAFVRDGKLLVVKRGREPNKGKFELTGGFVDFGETVYQAVIREASEELDVVVKQEDLKLLDVYYNDYNPGVFTIDVAFLLTQWQGEPQPSDDVAGIAWRPFDYIYDEAFCQKHYDGLDKAIATALAA